MSETFEEIAETFSFLDEWEDRYRYIIDLGKALPALAPEQCNPATKIDGCASQVWLVPEVSGSGDNAVLSFDGASDAMIVQGLIAILRALYNGKTVAEIIEINEIEKLQQLGLDKHLSSQRSNGLHAMIKRINEIAHSAKG